MGNERKGTPYKGNCLKEPLGGEQAEMFEEDNYNDIYLLSSYMCVYIYMCIYVCMYIRIHIYSH